MTFTAPVGFITDKYCCFPTNPIAKPLWPAKKVMCLEKLWNDKSKPISKPVCLRDWSCNLKRIKTRFLSTVTKKVIEKTNYGCSKS